MSAETALLLLTLFTIKHLVVDFLWQPEYEWKNKGTYGHPGGIQHSMKHIAASAWLLFLVFPKEEDLSGKMMLALTAGEFVIHYHMDWFKMNLNKWKGWGANTHCQFWYMVGFDQFVHMMTYIGMVYFLV